MVDRSLIELILTEINEAAAGDVPFFSSMVLVTYIRELDTPFDHLTTMSVIYLILPVELV